MSIDHTKVTNEIEPMLIDSLKTKQHLERVNIGHSLKIDCFNKLKQLLI